MKFAWLVTFGIALSGCAPYKSAGRKCLEASGLSLYEYHVEIGDAFAAVQISPRTPTGKWVVFEKNERGQMALNQEVGSELLVTLPSNFNCRFSFFTAQERAVNTDKALDHCIHQQLVTIPYPDLCQP